MRPALEIAVTSLAGVRAALAGGADRVELCSALELGGVTPSAGLVEAVVGSGRRDSTVGEARLGVHVLVRPRPGGFCYDRDEIALVEADVRAVVGRGADGVVVGALTQDGRLDADTVRRWADAARGTRSDAVVTLHRAVDHAAVWTHTAIAAAGLVDRVLTSGGMPEVGRAVDRLADLVREVGSSMEVVAGGGLRAEDVEALVAAGVHGLHLSARRRVSGTGAVALGVDDDGSHWVTDESVVRRVAEAIRAGY